MHNPGSGDAGQLLQLVYQDLHRIAEAKWGNRPGQTIQHTILVHEAWRRLVGFEQQHKAIGPTTFLAEDILDLESFALRLRRPVDPVSAFIGNTLDETVRAALAHGIISSRDREELQAALVQNLNRLISGPNLQMTNQFGAVVLRTETIQLLARRDQIKSFGRLNRLLLEDAYPAELSRQFHKRQFLHYAANVIQQIVYENSRRHNTLKRKGETAELDLELVGSHPDSWTPDIIAAMREALDEFKTKNPVEAELVLLLTYMDLSLAEAAKTIGLSEATTKRKWRYARIWLFNWLKRHA